MRVGTVETFGAVPNGHLSDDFADTTANGAGPNGVGTQILPSELKAGKFMIRLTANAAYSPVYYKDPSKVRIHLIGNRNVEAMLRPGTRFSRCLSWRWKQLPIYPLYAGDEIHAKGSGALANGPAPKNGPFWISSNQLSVVIRGGGNAGSSGSYVQWFFGEDRGNQPPNRFSQKWQGFSNTASTDFVHTFETFDWSADPSKGSYALWVCGTGGRMANVVPEKKIATCYPDPITSYPMVSDYFERSVAGWHIVDYLGGGFCLDDGELKYFQTDQLGFDPWGVTPSPVGKLRKKAETATTITLEWDPIPDAQGYKFYADGAEVSRSFDGKKTTVKFEKGSSYYGVLPLAPAELMEYRP